MTSQSSARRAGKHAMLTVLAVLVAFSSAPAEIAAEEKPMETKGDAVDSKVMLNLATQMPDLKGQALRMRKITMEPGAVLAHYSHAPRPTVVHIISSEFTKVRDGNPAVVRGPWDHWVEGVDIKHWGANRGQVPLVLIAVDIVPEE